MSVKTKLSDIKGKAVGAWKAVAYSRVLNTPGVADALALTTVAAVAMVSKL